MQVKRKKRVNMGIKRSEVAEPQWTKWDYAELIKHDLFSSELWKRTMDWNTILKHVKKMEIACLLIDKNCPSRLFSAYADLLEANLYILDDLFYFFTGIRIGCGEGLGIITAYSRLRFWNMVFYKEMKAIAVGLNRIEQHFLSCLPSSSGSVEDRAYAYAYAAYEEGEEDKEQVKNIIGFLQNYRTLTYCFDKTIEFAHINGLVEQYRQSKKGQEFIKPWRRDFAGSRDNLIAKLEKDPNLGLWVNKCTHLREDEDAVVQLFCDDIGILTNIEESCNVDNWLAIITIIAVLQEYDEQHAPSEPPTTKPLKIDKEILLTKLSVFIPDEAIARKFVDAATNNMNDRQIIALVKHYKKYGQCVDTSKALWDLLHEAGLYTAKYSNWSAQI